MITVNLYDSNFPHQTCSVATKTAAQIEYVRGEEAWDGITLFTDQWMLNPVVDRVISRYKIGWLHEARELKPEVYEQSKAVRHKFDCILTHDAELLRFDPLKYRFCIRGGSWVPRQDWRVYPKSKNVAMILSDKQQLSGHKLRHEIAKYIPGIDLFGPSYTPIGYNKALAYKDYRFAVVVEACREQNFFSEHLLDALAYGCMPLYWGCPNIHDFFSGRMIPLHSVAHLTALVELAKPRWYASFAEDVELNLQTALHYEITDDWIARNILQPMMVGVLA